MGVVPEPLTLIYPDAGIVPAGRDGARCAVVRDRVRSPVDRNAWDLCAREVRDITSMSVVVPQLLLDYEQAAKALSLSRAALRDLVYKSRGPVVTRIGRRTLFAVSDLQAFIEQHREVPRPMILDRDDRPRRKRGRPSIAELMARQAA